VTSVDVIVPCYRYGHFLKECVESVLSQSLKNLRVLIIDDDSPDNTAEIATELAKRDSRVTSVKHLKNKGHIATYNEGIEWINSDYYLLLSADDFLLPGALERATKLMDENPKVGFTFGNAFEQNENGERTEFESILNLFKNDQAQIILSGEAFIKISGVNNIVPTPTAIIRTDLQKKIGGYRFNLPHSGDMEMWLRLAANAYVGIISEPQAIHRSHNGNMSLNYFESCWLPDLEQRKLAIISFIQSCNEIISNPEKTQNELLCGLAKSAVSKASSAFNTGNMLLCNDILMFATNCCPTVKISYVWLKLTIKKFLGLKACNILQHSMRVAKRFF
jgi:glycosyltransferase involved in cell wall biosynthesis